ncbi:hypothetical protein GC173_02450 [bacterium]|nr:hypothetical protein [bacterium]
MSGSAHSERAHSARRQQVILTGAGAETLLPVLESVGLAVTDDPTKARFVLVYGGDGSLLGADREFPNTPKLIIRRNGEFAKCSRHGDEMVLRRAAVGIPAVTLLPRLTAHVRGECIQGINDVVFHNTKVTSGVRYRIRIDEQTYAEEIVGDGIVVATPFGSSAYYRSITKSVFRVGMGLAFNNSTEAVNHLVLSDRSVVEVHVTRGPGVLVADNHLDPIPVDAGDLITIRMGTSAAEIWEIDTLTCRDCIQSATGVPAGFRHV